jgi:hypothetical protein
MPLLEYQGNRLSVSGLEMTDVCRTVKISPQWESPNHKLSRKADACCTIKISARTMNPGALTACYFQGA